MATKRFFVVTALVGLLSTPALAIRPCTGGFSDTCDPKTGATFTLVEQCWEAKCSASGDTPIYFSVYADDCERGILELWGNATLTSCLTTQIAEDLADINQIKTECNGADGVQKLQVKATDKYPANSYRDVGCLSDDDCCGEAVCDAGSCGLPGGASCAANAECHSKFCGFPGTCVDED